MKKKMISILTMATLVLAACGDKEPDKPAAPSEGQTIETEQSADNARKPEMQQEPEEEPDEKQARKPAYEMNPNTYAIEPIGEANPKVVLLTIDDTPDKRALDMAETLKRLDAPAIFFVNGHFIDSEEEQEVLKKIYDMGFIIGNHTKTHANLKDLPEEEQREEILFVNDIVEKVTGEKPKFFRAPFGSNTDFSRSLAQQEGMLVMNWSYGYDFMKDYMTRESITDIMLNTELLRNGSNLLMHDREWTADGLEDIVIGLREKGYEMADPNEIKGIEEGQNK